MKRKVLFLCTGNSCRSQMAEGWLRHVGADRFEVFSAGTHPKPIHPIAIQVMRERGVDIAAQHSKHVDRVLHEHFEWVITVCDQAREHCPIYPKTSQFLHWSFSDPAIAEGRFDERLQCFREVRDQIFEKIMWFLSEGQR